MKPLVFLGHEFRDDAAFRSEYPAYAQYVRLVHAGADTPQKIEQELYRQNHRASRFGRKGTVKHRRTA